MQREEIDLEKLARLQQLGFGEEEIRNALLCFEGFEDDVERAGSWLLEQQSRREDVSQLPPTQETIAAPRQSAGSASAAVDRRLLAARALQRQARANLERREKEEARRRDVKAQEQAQTDRKLERARAAAAINLAARRTAEDLARSGRQAHAEAAEGRARKPLPPREPARGTRDRQATPDTAHPPVVAATPERKLRMLLQQESGLAAEKAAQVATLCTKSGVLASEPLILDPSPAGIEMRALMLESTLASLAGQAGAARTAVAAAESSAVAPPAGHPVPPPPPPSAGASVRTPAARDVIKAQEEAYAAALAADQRAEAEAAAAMAEKAERAALAVTTAVTATTAGVEEELTPVLSAQEIREKRIAALERQAAAEDDTSGEAEGR